MTKRRDYIDEIIRLREDGYSWDFIGMHMGTTADACRKLAARHSTKQVVQDTAAQVASTIENRRQKTESEMVQAWFERRMREEGIETPEEILKELREQFWEAEANRKNKALERQLKKYWKKEWAIEKVSETVVDHLQQLDNVRPIVKVNSKPHNGLMVEVPIVDLHLGKLGWAPEVGTDYDHKIAEERFLYTINETISRVHGLPVEKFLFILGSDYFNCDNPEGQTTNKTQQDNDSRFPKMYAFGCELLIKGINMLAQVAPVQAILVAGNHDATLAYMAAKHLEAWFRLDERVIVDADPTTRKYIEHGVSLIGFSHGDKEKKRIFGIMQVEAQEAWGRTKIHEIHLGHLHSEQTKEDAGIIVRNLSSVTSADRWHYQSGYVGAVLKTQVFIWDREKGLVNILMINLEVE